MRRFATLLVLIGGCKDAPTAPPDVEPVRFRASAPAVGVEGTLPDAVGDTHDALQALFALLGLVGYDVDVQDMLNVGPVPPDPQAQCWNTTATGTTRTLDYILCGQVVTGQITIERLTDLSRLLTTAANFSFGGRRLDDGLLLVPTQGDGSVFLTGAHDGAAPVDQLTVVVGDRTVDLPLAGRMELDPVAGRVYLWGSATPGAATPFVVGGADATAVDTDTRPPDVASAPFVDGCRCQRDGVITYTVDLTIDTVRLPLADALEDAGTLWPELPVVVDTTVRGALTVEPGVTCGGWTGRFAAETPIIVTGEALREAVDLGCTSGAFDSAEACERVRRGAAAVDALTIELSERVERELVEQLAAQHFDGGFCTYSTSG